MRAGQPGHLDDLRHRRPRHMNRDVVSDRAVEQKIFLEHDAHLAAQPHGVGLLQIDSINQDAAGLRHIQTLEQLRQGALTGAATPHDAYGRTRSDGA